MKDPAKARKRMPLVWRMTLSNTVMLFVLLAVFTSSFVVALFSDITHTRKQHLSESLDTIEARLSQAETLSANIFDTIHLKKAVQFAIYSPDKERLYTTVKSMPPLESLDDMSAAIRFNGEDPLGELKEDYEFTISSSRWVTAAGMPLYVHTFKDVTEEMEVVERMPQLVAVTLAVGLVLSFTAGRLVSRRVLRPISRISSRIQAISASSLSERLPENRSSDELEELALSFNRMIERLEQSFTRQKRFVSDASHELRTPLAVIQGHTSMLLRWGKDDPAIAEQSLKTMQAEIRGMTQLIDRLLILARNDDDAGARLHKERIPARAFLQEAADELLLLHPEARVDIRCNADTIVADRAALQQVLRILLDNSVKYSPPPAAVTLSAEAGQDGVLLSVSDSGSGIDADKLPFIFDRFFRADDSRTKNTGGTGLGLAIAKSIVESHGGTIVAQSRKGAGTQMRILLKNS